MIFFLKFLITRLVRKPLRAQVTTCIEGDEALEKHRLGSGT